MRKIIVLALIVFTNLSVVQAEELNKEIVGLAKIYRNFMFRNTPNESTYKQLESYHSPELAASVSFIKESITSDNQLATASFLQLPGEATLKNLYIIRRVDWNLREKVPANNFELIDALTQKAIPRYELVDNYYEMLFIGIGNKNQPFDLSRVNFEMYDYGFKDDTEKGIFFLKAMSLCGKVIWGYMNVAKPPNFKEAKKFIDKYPRFNGQPYYQYLDFGFADFEMEIEKGKGKESYKVYYIDKYYETLLSHLLCLSQKKRNRKEREDLLLGSILKESNYYNYSKHKEILESLFVSVKR